MRLASIERGAYAAPLSEVGHGGTAMGKHQPRMKGLPMKHLVTTLALTSLFLIGCGKKDAAPAAGAAAAAKPADPEAQCNKAYDNAISIIKADAEKAQMAAMLEDPEMRKKAIEDCKKDDPKKVQCLIDAKTYAEADACDKLGKKDEPAEKPAEEKPEGEGAEKEEAPK
jgi:hypothetical protein